MSDETAGKPSAPEGEKAIIESEWWRQAWAERLAALEEAFGKSAPPGAPKGMLLELPPDIRGKTQIPGGRLAVYPPDKSKKRPWWLLATIGLSQPLEAPTAKVDPENPAASRFGFELGIAVKEVQPWAIVALCDLAKLALAPPAPLKIGTRVPFTLSRPTDAGKDAPPVPCVARILPGHDPVGETAATILWPPLDRDGPFVTSTGRFDLLVATTITMSELDLAQETSSAHVVLLLRDAGIGQASDPGRKTVTRNDVWKRAWEGRISQLSREQVLDKLYGPA